MSFKCITVYNWGLKFNQNDQKLKNPIENKSCWHDIYWAEILKKGENGLSLTLNISHTIRAGSNLRNVLDDQNAQDLP